MTFSLEGSSSTELGAPRPCCSSSPDAPTHDRRSRVDPPVPDPVGEVQPNELSVHAIVSARNGQERYTAGYGAWTSVRTPIPAATFNPCMPSTLSGCKAMLFWDPPTRTLAPTPRPPATAAGTPP